MSEVSVLVVGGGPVGLATALELSHQGVDALVVERAPDTSGELLAKAGTLSARTMEFCRRWGIAEQVAGWGADPDYPRDTVYVTSLAGGRLIGRDVVASARARRESRSPEILRKCPQHVFDPILAAAVGAAERATIRYGTEYVSLQQDHAGVTAVVRDVHSGRPERVRAAYVVACDGAGSRVRRELGIAFEGADLDLSVSVMLRVPELAAYHDVGPATRYLFIGTQGTWATLTSVDYGALWRFTLLGVAADELPSPEDLRRHLDAALGRDDVPYEMLRPLPWRRSQYVAQTYRRGRVFLAGDAAHTMSPTGGHGLNTGLGDVVGLGWMLAAALHGWGGPHLLDAYGLERRPVAVRNGTSSTQNFEAWLGTGMDLSLVHGEGEAADASRAELGAMLSAKLRNEWHADGVRFGYRYSSPIVVPDGTPEPPDDPVEYVPTARPGHRAPHAWVAEGTSVLDVFGQGFTAIVLTGAEGADRAEAQARELAAAAAARGVPLRVHRFTDPDLAALYEQRLVLVRPDGHVAWRGRDFTGGGPGQVLDRARGCAATR